MAEPIFYFAYGSNLDPDRMRMRVRGAEPHGTALLRNHALVFAARPSRWVGGGSRSGVANFTWQPGAVLHGALYILPADGLSLLDGYEGAPWIYQRCSGPVVSDGAHIEAWYYGMSVDGGAAAPDSSYLEYIRRGYAFWRLPRSYLDAAERQLAPKRGGWYVCS